MSSKMEKLKRDYRDITAPPYLATRIKAEIAERLASSNSWRPSVTAIVLTIAAVTFVPLLLQQQAAQTMKSRVPSLTMLSRAIPAKPAVAVPGLSKLRSIKTPPLPTRPTISKMNESQTFFETEANVLKETDYA